MKRLFILIQVLLICITMNAQDRKLPAPEKEGGMPLMEALAKRKSNREFSGKELTDQQLSNLLWAANGVTREDGRRTAPSARNMQQIDIYLFMKDGIWLYDAKNHSIKRVKEGDHRNVASNTFAHQASVLLVFVANYDKMEGLSLEMKEFYGATDCGNVSQNVYLYCTSAGFNTVALGSIDRDKIKELLGFNGKAILAQPVGN